MVVQHRQRMAATAREREMTLEVHLPQRVRYRPLKPPGPLARRTRRRIDPPITAQDLGDGARARDPLVPKIAQTPRDLAAAPGGMLIAQPHDQTLDRPRRACRRVLRPTRAIGQTSLALLAIPARQLVAPLGADLKAPTQLTPVRPLLLKQHHELAPLVHRRPSPPTMSPNARPVCLRSEQRVPGIHAFQRPRG